MPRRSRHREANGVRVAWTRLGQAVIAEQNYPESAIIGEFEGQVIDDPQHGSEYCMDIGDGLLLEPAAPFRFLGCPTCRS